MAEITPSARNPSPDHITLCHTLRGHTKEILSLAWSPDGTRLASGSADGTLRLWEGSSGTPLFTSEDYMGWGIEVQWSPGGTRLLSWASDYGIRLWDGRSVTLLHELGREEHPVHLDYIHPVQWSPNGIWLTSRSVEGTVCLWNGINGKLVSILGRNMGDVFWSPDGTQLASYATETMQVWDESSGQSLQILQRGTNAWLLEWSPDGKQLASGFKDGEVRLWESDSGKLLHILRGHRGWVRSLAWSPDGTQLASGSSDRTVGLWDGRSGQSLGTLEKHNNEVKLLAWSPDGMWLASGTYSPDAETEVRIRHTSTWQLLAIFPVRARWASFAWHPSLPLLATAALSSGEICLWQLDGEA
jgi:WD40 repeat protein